MNLDHLGAEHVRREPDETDAGYLPPDRASWLPGACDREPAAIWPSPHVLICRDPGVDLGGPCQASAETGHHPSGSLAELGSYGSRRAASRRAARRGAWRPVPALAPSLQRRTRSSEQTRGRPTVDRRYVQEPPGRSARWIRSRYFPHRSQVWKRWPSSLKRFRHSCRPRRHSKGFFMLSRYGRSSAPAMNLGEPTLGAVPPWSASAPCNGRRVRPTRRRRPADRAEPRTIGSACFTCDRYGLAGSGGVSPRLTRSVVVQRLSARGSDRNPG
jgi:hypothetical protein